MPAIILDTPPPQTPVFVPGIGRLAAPDPRDRRFEVSREMVREYADVPYRYWIPGAVLDQGSTSQCVAYSTVAALLCSPIRQPPHVTIEAVYQWCQQHDEWPGEDYEGTSTRACM